MATGPPTEVLCTEHRPSTSMRRDYKRDGVQATGMVQMKNDRENGGSTSELFLPSNSEFAGPGDPDGNKGMRDWRDSVKPTDDNRKPRWPGSVDKKVW